MAHEKQYTPKQAALAVLEKVGELLQKSELVKSDVKGVHAVSAQYHRQSQGQSEAGNHIRNIQHRLTSPHGAEPKNSPGIQHNLESSKEKHKAVLSDLKAMPSPNLGKAEGFKHTDTHAGHDIHVGQEGGKWAHQYFKHGSGYVHGSNSGAIFPSKEKAVEGAKVKISANLKKSEEDKKSPTSQNECNEKVSLMRKAEQPGKINPKQKEQAPSDNVRAQVDPQHNPKEQAEGNNELAGTTPTQVGQDGKNIPGFDEIRGHIKLAKFLGRMEHKRISKKAVL